MVPDTYCFFNFYFAEQIEKSTHCDGKENRMKYAVVTGGSKNDYDAIATLIVNMTEVMPDLQADYIYFMTDCLRSSRIG